MTFTQFGIMAQQRHSKEEKKEILACRQAKVSKCATCNPFRYGPIPWNGYFPRA